MKEICGNCFAEAVNEQGVCASCGFECRKSREAHPQALPAGSILYGRYIVGKVLGQGGFGITYLAQDYQTKNLVAIKEFFPDTMATRSGHSTVTPFTGDRSEHFAYGRSTFLNEAKTMAEFIGQQNIVQVYSYFEENNTGYFVMEYVEGCSLQNRVKQNYGRVSWDEAVRLILPVMDALSMMHEKGIIHRDVTPDNIYIKNDGSVKLLDFGAARHSLGNVSRSLDVVVKHGFAPKEQYQRHGRQGPFTDVYSVAATIYYSITGTRPDDAIERLDEDNLPLPSTLGANVTIEQENVLLKGLAIRAEDRYQTMAAFRDAIAAVTSVKPVPVVIPADVPAAGPKMEILVTGPAEAANSEAKTEIPAVTPVVREEPEKTEAPKPVEPEPVREEAVAAVISAAVADHEETDKTVMIAASVPTDIPPRTEQAAVPPTDTAQPKKKKRSMVFAVIAGVLVCALLAFWFLHPHYYGEWEVVKDATCITEGESVRKCFCGDTETQVITKRNHTKVIDEKVSATCSETGLTEGCHCSVCGAVLVKQYETPMTDHDIITLAAVPPTCAEHGLTEGRGCSVCGYVEVPQDVINALGHTSVKDAAQASTCAVEGKTEGSHCSVCGKVLVEQTPVALADHSPVTDSAVASTCTETGLTEGSHCSVCGKVLTAQQTVALRDHSPTKVAAIAATCTSTGLTEGTKCSVCGKVIKAQQTVAKTDHTPTKVAAVAATCTSTGLTEGTKCSVCGKVIKAQQTVAKTDHTPTKISAVAATCTESGLTEGSKCSVCGKVLKEQSKTNPLGHSFSGFYCSRCDLEKFEATCANSGSWYSINEKVALTFEITSHVAGATTGIYIEYEVDYDNGEYYEGSLTLDGTYGDGDGFEIGWGDGLPAPCTVWIYVYTSDGYYLGLGYAFIE